MFTKVENKLKFSQKRDFKLITPCCIKSNSDGKFANYKDLPNHYGYCHSCGKATLPPIIYKNENGEEFIWDEENNKYVVANMNFTFAKPIENPISNHLTIRKSIPESIVEEFFLNTPENNLLLYLKSKYGIAKVQDAKEVYALGTTTDGGIVFWTINVNLEVQKCKIVFYNQNGKRNNQFKVPYKNQDGYLGCLFGEHLLSYEYYKTSTIILVESEKTAIVGYILMPKYAWLAYGGCNGLTTEKTSVLKGFRVLLIPDLSENAVSIATKKIIELRQNGINIKLWDMTEGKSDEELKQEGIYNNDLEDYFRKLVK